MARLFKALLALGLIACLASVPVEAKKFKVRLSDKELYELAEAQLDAGKRLKGRDTLKLLRDRFPASQYATLAQLRLADSFFDQKRFTDAAVEYQLFIEFHPANPKADYAQYRLAMCRYEEVRVIDRDQTNTVQALGAFRKLLKLFPASPYAVEAAARYQELEDHLAAHDMYVGRFYYRTGFDISAEDRLRDGLDQLQDRDYRAKTLYFLALTLIEMREMDEARALLRQLLLQPANEFSEKAAKKLRKIGNASTAKETVRG